MTNPRWEFAANISSQEREIVEQFRDKVYLKTPILDSFNDRHDGRGGHWLEQQMGIAANANNDADLLGYEMKNQTGSKTTFGDWSADYYIFKSRSNPSSNLTRDEFMRIFGKPNPDKGDRCSWSGSPIPSIDKPSAYNGSKMRITHSNDIEIFYEYANDPRENKSEIIPEAYRYGEVMLARWDGASLRKKFERKFSQNGWFTCKRDGDGRYISICFGEPMNFENWLELVRKKIVFFDSGMYLGNKRNYSQWRAMNSYWEALIVRCYPSLDE